MYKISQLESISVKFRKLLLAAGIEEQDDLLEACNNKAGRQTLAQETGINPNLILKWTSQADLARINGIGQEYAELLVQSGILSVQHLDRITAERLLLLMQKNNEQTKLVRSLPSQANIESWIEQAKKLPARIEI